MQTSLTREIASTLQGETADRILRKCVHCGFCNATCPTYQLLGDERDGPRGRIYLIKQLLEGEPALPSSRLHLDRCLTCRACETTCPSGVEYGKLLEVGRSVFERRLARPRLQRWVREWLAAILLSPRLFSFLLAVGRLVRPVLPSVLKNKVPERPAKPLGADRIRWPKPVHPRKMVVLGGCVQATFSPDTNAAAATVLDRFGISLIEASAAGCCGSLDLHTTDEHRARQRARNLIDAWWPWLDQGVEGFIVTASGCAVTVKEYDHLFHEDQEYHEKARLISGKTFDLSEVIDKEYDPAYRVREAGSRVAFHSPCTLQHGQQIKGKVEAILERAGYRICEVADAHLCCGSAGTYSLLQPGLSRQLQTRKIAALQENNPDIICTANVGCQVHLNSVSSDPVRHWIELLV